MATDQIDSIIGYLNALKEQKLELELKDVEIKKYINLLLTNKSTNYDDCFMIYSYDNDEEAIDIIGRHLMEFSEKIYDHNYLLIAKKEVNRNLGIYLMPFENSCRLETTLKAIEDLIEIKRHELDNESYSVPSKRIVPEVQLINHKMTEIVKKMEKSDETAKKMSEKLMVLTPETEKMSRNMSKMNEKMNILNNMMNTFDDVNKQLNKVKRETAEEMTIIQQEIDELKLQSKTMFGEIKSDFETSLEKLQFIEEQTKKNEERRRLREVNKFYAQRNLEYVRNSPEILDKMCMRLSVKNDGDDSRAEAPFKDIISMKEKKKELIAYFDLLQKSLGGATEETEMQINIKEWMAYNWPQLLYKPTTLEKDEWKKEMEEKLKVKSTIGTTCYITFIWNGREYYFFFCIANSKIICWSCGTSKERALKSVYDHLKNVLKWDTNAKFTTDMEVSDELSDYFVHVSTDDIMKMSNNQKVMEWMTNNFDSLKYSFKEKYHHSFPAIYNLALNYFEESMEQ